MGNRWNKVVHSILREPFRRRDKSPDIDEDKEQSWEVEVIVNSRRVKGVVQHLVWWRGCTELEHT